MSVDKTFSHWNKIRRNWLLSSAFYVLGGDIGPASVGGGVGAGKNTNLFEYNVIKWYNFF